LENNELESAIQHARKYFPATYQDQDLRLKICSVMGVLASRDIVAAINQNFNRKERFVQLECQFLNDFLAVNGLTKTTFLERLLSVGIKCIDLGSCQEDDHSLQCPACYVRRSRCLDDLEGQDDDEGQQESLHVLRFKLSRSHLVCFISGEVMNSDNLPMALPNGYVYSSKAIKKMAENNAGIVTCPRTHESFSMSDCKVIYVL